MIQLTEDESRTENEAIAFARANKKAIAKRVTDPNVYSPEEHPVSVFMAGSPGAGKTESSIELLKQFEAPVIRIDADALREEFPAYKGANAWLFQKGASILVDKIHDLALDQRQSFVLDGTLSNYERARTNIERSLKKKRTVQILYVYQEPRLAWRFVQARESAEGRRIPAEKFVDQYFLARDAVNRIKRDFGKEVRVDLLLKNIDNSTRTYHAGVDQIDNYIPENYSRDDVEKIVRES